MAKRKTAKQKAIANYRRKFGKAPPKSWSASKINGAANDNKPSTRKVTAKRSNRSMAKVKPKSSRLSSAYKSIRGSLGYAAKNPLTVAKMGAKGTAGFGIGAAADMAGRITGGMAGKVVGRMAGGRLGGEIGEAVGTIGGGSTGISGTIGVAQSLAARKAAKQAGKKMGIWATTKLAASIGSKAIPGVGLAYTAVEVALYLYDKKMALDEKLASMDDKGRRDWRDKKVVKFGGGEQRMRFNSFTDQQKEKFKGLDRSGRKIMLANVDFQGVLDRIDGKKMGRNPEKSEKPVTGKTAGEVKAKAEKVSDKRRGEVKLKPPTKTKRRAVVKKKAPVRGRKKAAKPQEKARFQTTASGELSKEKWTDSGWAARKAAAKKRKKS